jgi:hypothetical protein
MVAYSVAEQVIGSIDCMVEVEHVLFSWAPISWLKYSLFPRSIGDYIEEMLQCHFSGVLIKDDIVITAQNVIPVSERVDSLFWVNAQSEAPSTTTLTNVANETHFSLQAFQ